MKVKVTITVETDLDSPTHETFLNSYGSLPGFVDAVWAGDDPVVVEIEAAE